MLGIRRRPKNHYKKPPSEGRPFLFRHIGFLLKTSFALTVLVMMSFFFIIVYNLVVQWNYLNVKTFSVKGNTHLSGQQIIDQSQLDMGKNILSINLSAARKRLVAHPMISEAEIIRHFPSEITIMVREHQPMAVLDLGRKFAINYSGEIFIEIDSSEFGRIPIIAGFNPSDIDSKGEIKGVSFNEVIKILHLGLKPGCILSTDTIKRIDVDKQTGLTVSTLGRMKTIKLGYGDYPKKYERLKTIFAFLNERPDLEDYISVDLNNLKRIVLKTSRI